ncbi:hypothetical protein A6A19_00950 [Actinobacillus delphinicola]|uniref:HP1 family phage holin n=1 Tax=Actinobacillus delphinicola TaxID=51161 RepID=UPI0024410218|nr:HP1 family phage holin [Actinobacillus delphinicola]MDG6896597.1 hypothetical protein [Actinobacillus delphinicola]
MGLGFSKHDLYAYWGACASILSGLTLSDWAAVFGILFGFGTFLVNAWYKHQEYKLLKEKYEKENSR